MNHFCNYLIYLIAAPNLSESPNKGQIVIAPFCDGNNYRAMVMDVKDDKAKIAYIDFGNIDYVSVKELKVLPEDLARVCDLVLT